MNTLQRIPDPPADGAGEAPKPKKKGYIARSDTDFANQSLAVATWWNTGNNGTLYPLLYITAPDLLSSVTRFNTTLGSRLEAGSQRPMLTRTLEQLDEDIDTAVKQMRLDIGSKFGAAKKIAAYPLFGFVHKNKSWDFPADHNMRLPSITLCKNAITANGMTTIEYNAAWWAQMETNYETAMKAASDTDSTVSGKVGSKNMDKAGIKKAIKSIRLLIEANHPDDFKSILRVAGFQKEDF